FGFSLGKTEFDGQIYGAASAAADCFKALVPFFLFAAIKNRIWSQAAAAAVVWVVVTAYSLTSALGHAALNRFDTTGQRAVDAQVYKDLRADLKRAQDQLSWIPQHRPAASVQSAIDGLKGQPLWKSSKGCADQNRWSREFCQQYFTLTAELAAGQQAVQLEARIAEISTKLAAVKGGQTMAEADPQAVVLARLAGLALPNVKVEDIQTALTIFVALLLEIGSGFGMYVAFSQWRLYDRQVPAVTETRTTSMPVSTAHVEPIPAPIAVPAATAVAAQAPPVPALAAPAVKRVTANDNKVPVKGIAPETDVERFYKERIETTDGSTVTATELYEDYCAWCEQLNKEPLALPTFGREFGELGVQKQRIGGRTRYIGIALKAAVDREEDKKLTASISHAA
ncbi:MAG TPA: hypothetical protein PK264_18800, partial [Hyphomicrobiaceae bacterium]|nr:hypothetical protein [Hyphomicrobiaceae bacterium]